MSDEIPIPNPPLRDEEQAVVAALSDTDLQTINTTILAHASTRWLKVARVVGLTADTLQHRFPRLSHSFYAQRVSQLVADGRLDSQGNLLFMRFSEVRLPLQSRPAHEQ